LLADGVTIVGPASGPLAGGDTGPGRMVEPEEILAASYQQVCRRLEQVRQDHADITHVHEHWWQQLNPVTTEARLLAAYAAVVLGASVLLYDHLWED
jgi:phosphopantothenoylcysteine synthetase/decarboxylase